MSEFDDLRDESLSSAWRALSDEQTPAGLDRSILQAAKQRPRLANLLSLKPLAWAAVMVLTVGVVLELQRSAPELLDQPAAYDMPAEAPAPERADSDQFAAPEPEVASESPSAAYLAAPATAEQDETPQIQQDMRRSMLKLSTEGRGVLEEAERLSEEDQLEEVVVTGVNGRMLEDSADLQASDDLERFCETAVTVDPGSWYRCVLELREEGLQDEADFELSLLMSRFPEFEIR